MQEIPSIADRIPEVFAWLDARGVAPAGAPFLRYHLIDMERQLQSETAGGQRWGCRLEMYKTDPSRQPDMSRWETELAFRLAG